MSISVVILAAGFGTRMKSETSKVLQPLCGEKMIDFVVENAIKLSDDVKVVLYHQKDEIIKYLDEKYNNFKFDYITQDMQNHKGTGGALYGISYRYDDVIILNGDMPLVSIDSLLKLKEYKSDLVVSAFLCHKPNSYGKVVTNGDDVIKIVESKDANEEEKKIALSNAGVYKVKKSLLDEFIPNLGNNNAQNEYYLTDIVKMATDKKCDVKTYISDEDEFLGVNSKLDLELAESKLQEKIKNYWLEQGVIMHNKQSIYISKQTKFIGECEIYENSSFYGKNIIEKSVILAGSVIEDSVILNSQLGPHARVRPKCDIKSSRIGNFVECKNAKLDGVKAGHLSYLGDCVIESGVNIGCGVVICNYDGKSKHQTNIGKNAFIGSNTNLIAPITIPEDTLIAAGSTLGAKQTKDLKQKGLFYQRADFKIIDNFKDF